MSFLAPLYLLAAAAITLPILFHLIQRRPRGEQLFSSLMFLSPSPPRMVRRSRLDQWLLLLLRALALLAIAFAFMRPFFRSSSTIESGALGRQRIILVDTSASMQRTGIWNRATKIVQETIAESTPDDLVALYRFDSTLKPIISFESILETTPSQRADRLRKAISDIKPSWLPTDMGRGLSMAAETLQTAVNSQNVEESIGGEIILISDFSGTVNLSQLEGYDWPKGVRVIARSVELNNSNNATLTSLSASDQTDKDDTDLRVLITNSASAETSQFQVQFLDNQENILQTLASPYQVNAGERRVIRLSEIPSQATSVQLIGDTDPSDNRVYFAIPQKKPTSVWLLQASADSRESQLGFFVERIPLNSTTLEVFFKRLTPVDFVTVPDPNDVSLIIVDSSIDERVSSLLRDYVEKGGKVILALDQPITEENQPRITLSLKKLLANENIQVSEASVRDYAMWTRIDFRHPLFSPFADPRFNDFTKLRTWRHRIIELTDPDNKPIASYDDGTGALHEIRVGNGRVWLFASGWQPAESQLALSTKFVPLMIGIFRFSGEKKQWPQSLFTGQNFPALPNAACQSPSGTLLSPNSDNVWELDVPGIYELRDTDKKLLVTVNILPREFDLSKLDPDRLEQLGVATGPLPTAEYVRNQQRLMRNSELEKQQQVWRWCILLAVILIALETAWSSIGIIRATPAT